MTLPARPKSVPTSLPEMIELAEFYLARLHATQDVVDLYPAVLATVHVPDWLWKASYIDALTITKKMSLPPSSLSGAPQRILRTD